MSYGRTKPSEPAHAEPGGSLAESDVGHGALPRGARAWRILALIWLSVPPIFLVLSVAVGDWVTFWLLLPTWIVFLIAIYFGKDRSRVWPLHLGVGALVVYQTTLLYMFREVPNLGVVWLVSVPLMAALFRRVADVVWWSVLALVSVILCWSVFPAQPPIDHPLALPNLVLVTLLVGSLSASLVSDRWRIASVHQARTKSAESVARTHLIAERVAREAATEARERLATVSHEARTPLMAILLSAEQLRDASQDEIQPIVRDLVINAGVLRATVDEVLGLARVTEIDVMVDRTPFPLQELVAQLRAIANPAAKRRGLSTFIAAAPDVPSVWQADPMLIRHVVVNLLTNAVKFTESGYVVVWIDAGPDFLRFTVRDTGCGIETTELERIFEQHVRGPGSEGAGLGLPIARRIARSMGGKISASSVVGRGSTFVLEIPAAPISDETVGDVEDVDLFAQWHGDAVDDPVVAGWLQGWREHFSKASTQSTLPEGPDEEDAPSQGGLTCCIVEDNLSLSRIIARTLARTGFTVIQAQSGEAFLQLIRKERIDFAFVDFGLPGMTGLDVVRAVRSLNKPYADMPLVVASGEPFDAERPGSALVDGWLLKPIGPNQLFQHARRMAALGRKRRTTSPESQSTADSGARDATS